MRALTALLTLLLVAGCTGPQNALERIKARGELVVVTVHGAATYVEGPDVATGFEYDLAEAFANSLGVELKVVVVERSGEVIPTLLNGGADLAAAGLTETPERKKQVRFGPAYQQVRQQLVYHVEMRKPRNIDSVRGGVLEVSAGSDAAEQLRVLKEKHKNLKWRENADADSEELMQLLWDRLIDYTIVDSNVFTLNRSLYPELRVAFAVSEPIDVAWAFPPTTDSSLYDAAVQFFAGIKKSKRLAQLKERYYGHVTTFDYVGVVTYLTHIKQRLPALRPFFEAAAAEHDLDWRLLAAMGYQESHWNPDAVSPTGVRGIMMLTQATARRLGVRNRTHPEQSIFGGARYFRMQKDRLPERIPEPIRTWMALAAYNVGHGHLEDARMLAQKIGGDPDRWIDVKKALPLLSQRKWYSQTRLGYARGMEPVRYVENVRSYYAILASVTAREIPILREPKALSIDAPAL